jgi:uncharacterized protein (TIGR02145 family)
MILEACLEDFLAGNKLRESGITHWNHPNRVATNESGFTALGGGYRSHYGNEYDYFHKGIEGGWWASTEDGLDPDLAHHVTLGYNYSIIGGCNCPKTGGYSVRCLKD